MKRKIWAVLMALVLVVGVVPTVAKADTHVCTYDFDALKYQPVGNEKHALPCTECKKLTSVPASCKDEDYDGKCDVCSGEVHKHEAGTGSAKSSEHGTHYLTCSCGKVYYTKELNCDDRNGDNECDSCGYVMFVAPEGEHEHNYVAHSNNDGTHTSSCNCGLEVKNVTCLDNDGDGKCDACGYQKYTAPENDHEHNYVAHSNNDGTHLLTCNCGLEVKNVTCLDNDGDGKCDSCGYQKYTAPEGEHEHNYVAHSNKNGTHNMSCNCGLEVKNVTCLDNDGDGKCDSCGYQKYTAPENDHEHNYVAHSNNDGTHLLTCNCGLEVKNVTCLDNDGDGKCDSCGYQKYVATCNHEFHGLKDNKDGLSHNVVCRDCGKTLEVKVAHEYKDGVCACGAITEVPGEDDKEEDKPVVTPGEDDKEEDKPVVTPGEDDKEEDKPVVTPEDDADDADDSKDTAANEDAELDEVPETGNGGVVTVLISLVVVGLAGVLVFLQANKRKGM